MKCNDERLEMERRKRFGDMFSEMMLKRQLAREEVLSEKQQTAEDSQKAPPKPPTESREVLLSRLGETMRALGVKEIHIKVIAEFVRSVTK